MKASIKYLIGSIIYGILMIIIKLVKNGNIYNSVELFGNFMIYAIAFFIDCTLIEWFVKPKENQDK